jgi:hypothetical protein
MALSIKNTAAGFSSRLSSARVLRSVSVDARSSSKRLLAIAQLTPTDFWPLLVALEQQCANTVRCTTRERKKTVENSVNEERNANNLQRRVTTCLNKLIHKVISSGESETAQE